MTPVSLAPMTIADAVEALRDIGADPVMRHDRAGREYWQHRCAHPDHHDSWPSATLTTAPDGTLLLNCFSCAPPSGAGRARWVAQTLSRLDARTPKDPATGSPKRGRPSTGTAHGVKTAHYDYVDGDGVIRARKVRFEDGRRKTFLWQRPYSDDGGVWVDGLRGKPLRELPLYGLASIPAEPGGVVYVVEGEKDVDRLHAEGVAAVTAAGSAPTDIPDDLTALAGHVCIVIADRDDVGGRLAHGWAGRLTAAGITAILAQPRVTTPKADVSDHLDAGLDLAELDFGPIAPQAPTDAPDGPLSPPVAEPDHLADLPPTIADELAADRLLGEEVARLLRVERARQIVAEIRERANPKPPPDVGTLTELLARPETLVWRIEDVLPLGARMLFTAQRKTGKTTATGNLARALLTGEAFLGQYHVEKIAGRVGVLNYEVTGAQFARWMDDIGVPGDRMYVENLRGCTNPLTTEEGRTALIERLRAAEVEVLIVDPFGRAYHGKDQNDAAQVTPWLVTLDQVAEQAGASELILTAHAGWNGERTRGSSALEDWPDVIVTLTKDSETGQRYIRAEGRDVELAEDRIEYHDLTRTYTVTGEGSRAGAADRRNMGQLVDRLLTVVTQEPGIGTRGIARLWQNDGYSFRKGDVQKASEAAVEQGLVVIRNGPNRVKEHYLTQVSPVSPSVPRGHLSSVPSVPIEGDTGRNTQEHQDRGTPATLADLLSACSGCGLPAMTNPCTTCRRGGES